MACAIPQITCQSVQCLAMNRVYESPAVEVIDVFPLVSLLSASIENREIEYVEYS